MLPNCQAVPPMTPRHSPNTLAWVQKELGKAFDTLENVQYVFIILKKGWVALVTFLCVCVGGVHLRRMRTLSQ